MESSETGGGQYWKIIGSWVAATRERYRGQSRNGRDQCFMKGTFAGWSDWQVAALADQMADSATRFPLRGRGGLDGGGVEPVFLGQGDQTPR